MNMGRKKSKRSTKDTTCQNQSDTPSGNSVSTANSGSSLSISRSAASTANVSISSRSISRSAASTNVKENQRVSSQTSRNSTSGASAHGGSLRATTRNTDVVLPENRKGSSQTARSAASTNVPENQRVSSQTSRNSTSGASAHGGSFRATTRNTDVVLPENRKGSSQTARSTASTNVPENQRVSSQTSRNSTSGASAHGGSLRTTTDVVLPENRKGSSQTASRNLGSDGAVLGVSLQSTTSSAAVPHSRNGTVQTDSRNSALSDNAQGGISLSTSRNSTSTTRPATSQTTRSTTRRDPILYPMFFVIQAADGSKIRDWSGESISEIENILRRVDCITPLRDGSFLVKAKSQSQSNTISNITTISNRPVSVVPHSKLNSSQGTIYCKGLLMCSDDEILDHFRSQHVTKVYRIRKRVNGTLVNTPMIVLTFDTPHPPKQVKAGFLSLQVRWFFPIPRRCFNCQSFQHVSKYCSATPVCPLCGETGHTYPPRCNNPVKCVNCLEDDHTATSSECPTFKMEKKVLELQAIKKIGIADARIRIANQILSGRLVV